MNPRLYLQRTRKRGRTSLVPPHTERIVSDRCFSAIVRSKPELDRFVLWDGDESLHVDHEPVVCAVLKRLPVVGAVDVVLDLRPAFRVQGV